MTESHHGTQRALCGFRGRLWLRCPASGCGGHEYTVKGGEMEVPAEDCRVDVVLAASPAAAAAQTVRLALEVHVTHRVGPEKMSLLHRLYGEDCVNEITMVPVDGDDAAAGGGRLVASSAPAGFCGTRVKPWSVAHHGSEGRGEYRIAGEEVWLCAPRPIDECARAAAAEKLAAAATEIATLHSAPAVGASATPFAGASSWVCGNQDCKRTGRVPKTEAVFKYAKVDDFRKRRTVDTYRSSSPPRHSPVWGCVGEGGCCRECVGCGKIMQRYKGAFWCFTCKR